VITWGDKGLAIAGGGSGAASGWARTHARAYALTRPALPLCALPKDPRTSRIKVAAAASRRRRLLSYDAAARPVAEHLQIVQICHKE
jgi:hypothetical protein